jgi:hypothetical protein
MNRPGRNDPCPCGSGKKYKKCHLELDARTLSVNSGPADSETAAFAGSTSIKNALNLLRDFAVEGPATAKQEFDKLIAAHGSTLDYLAHREEIEAASRELETHRSEFDKLFTDADRLGDITGTLFSEECFVPLRFTPVEIKRAFDHVGYPAMISPDERTVQTLRAAILYLADEERRNHLALSLFSLLPRFTAAHRFMEASLIQCSACETAERPDESNPFLFHMFALGYDAWAAEKRSHDKSFLQELGIDVQRISSMTIDEVDEWLATQAADPSKTKAMEAFFEEHSDLRAESVANLEAMEGRSVELLKREDCQWLILQDHEIEPWLNRLNEVLNRHLQQDGTEKLSEESIGPIFEEYLVPCLREMAESVFTPDRIQQLVFGLKKFRSEKFAAEDRSTVSLATGALDYLKREGQPGQNAFLLHLCWASLTQKIDAGAHETVVPESKPQ